ncbi:hypothetical protein LNP74_05930 [Klebsiella pneumoniae subsp. pneumoniae]|nr:hypothetical protein [Klebsiella pneumoniae subsp. pneumoniae]
MQVALIEFARNVAGIGKRQLDGICARL